MRGHSDNRAGIAAADMDRQETDMRDTGWFWVRKAQARDIPALMRLKRLLAESEDSLHALRATPADWLRDGFGQNPGFTAFVAELSDRTAASGAGGDGNRAIGMATCSQRSVTGWDTPVILLQDLFVKAEYRGHGVARALVSRVAVHARALNSPIIELTVRADNPAQAFYLRTGFRPLPQCITFVISGTALETLANSDKRDIALAG
jgi:ribosomal protein S18 acetylase RimI-like enzyme